MHTIEPELLDLFTLAILLTLILVVILSGWAYWRNILQEDLHAENENRIKDD